MHAVEEVRHAALGHESTLGEAVERAAALLQLAIVEVGHGVLHLAVEGHTHLDEGKAVRQPLHPFGLGGVVLGRDTLHGPADGAVVAAHLVPDLAAEQLMDRQARGLAGEVPERHLDRADGTAPGLERAALPDPEHAALDVGRVLADQRLAVVQHEGLEVGLVLLGLAIAREALVGDDADDRVGADDGAPEVGDPHFCRPFSHASYSGRASLWSG
ncbi:MAG: hypothetical protein R3C69_18335 [Geminicoccaceae bacterium]